MLGPEGSNNSEFIERVFERARGSGAQEIASSEANNSQKNERSIFGGSAHRLGGYGLESRQDPQPASNTETPVIYLIFN